MTKVGRNESCPCGSGKKYKHCCLGNDIEENIYKPIEDLKQEIHNAIRGRVFESIDDANDFLRQFTDRKNSEPMPEFLGLSPDIMHRLLSEPLERLKDIVCFNRDLEPGAFKDIPIVKNTVYFLERMKQSQPMKATAKGNLPISFARELDVYSDSLLSQAGFSIRSEEENPVLHGLRLILTMCGWIKKVHNRFSLTKKGDDILQKGFSESHFFTLLQTFTRSFNWAFMDRYDELRIIRDSFIFSLYTLHIKAGRPVEAETIGDCFLKAFPMTLLEADDIAFMDTEDYVKSCFSLRFLERFCEYFGFIDVKREEISFVRSKLIIKKSVFFDRYIDWSNISKAPRPISAPHSKTYH
jgi:hypothetical protein